MTEFAQSLTKRLHLLFLGIFEKKILQSVTNEECFTNFKIIIAKYDKKLLQSVTGITKLEKKLLKILTGITKRDSYYKGRHNNV